MGLRSKQEPQTEIKAETAQQFNDPDLEAIAAEFPEWADQIAIGADFTSKGLTVENPDPKMRYYFAAKDDPSRVDGVERVKQLGYKVSSKEHNSPDCELMECPQKLYDYRMAQQAKRNRQKMRSIKRHVEEGEGPLEPMGDNPRGPGPRVSLPKEQ